MNLPLFHVDAFTDKPFSGNPAAVCILPGWRDDRWLQAVASEMNLSETAFLVQKPGHFDLRWFTLKVEVDHCGHATLADFWPKRLGKSDFVAYQASARGGVVKVRVQGDRAFLGGKAVIVAKGEWIGE